MYNEWFGMVTEVCIMSALGSSGMGSQYKTQNTHSTWYLFEHTGYLVCKTFILDNMITLYYNSITLTLAPPTPPPRFPPKPIPSRPRTLGLFPPP